MHIGHDHLFRQTFGDPQNAASLLSTILPGQLARAIDWSSLQLVPGSWVDDHLRGHHADLLFAARLAGEPLLLYLLLEHKSQAERFTAYQLLRYSLCVWQAHRASHPDVDHLPPLVPVVVHHGSRAWRQPRSVLELVDLDRVPADVARVLNPLQPNLHFLLDDLADTSASELRARDLSLQARLTLLLLQFVRGSPERDPTEFVRRWRDLWQELWRHPRGKPAILALLSYLAWQLEAPTDRLVAAAALIHEQAKPMGKTIAEQLIEQGIKKGQELGKAEGKELGKAEGKAEGKELGRAEGMRQARIEMLSILLQARFGPLPAAVEERLRAAEVADLDRWARQILDATSLDAALS